VMAITHMNFDPNIEIVAVSFNKLGNYKRY
jgi:hypothetical protein